MKPSNILWGLTILGLGIMILGINLGWFPSSVVGQLFALWPLVLIIIGLKFIVRNDIVFTVISLILIVAAFGYVVYGAKYDIKVGSFSLGQKQTKSIQKYSDSYDLSNVKAMTLTLDVGAANVVVDSLPEGDKTTLYQITATDLATLGIDKSVSGGVANLRVAEKTNSLYLGSGYGSNRAMTIYLSRNIPIAIKLNSGATKNKLNLQELQISSLVIHSGASDVVTTFGSKQKLADVNIETGAASVVLNIPKSSGVKATLNGGLSSYNLSSDFEFTKSGDTNTSANYDASTNRINITVRSGATSVSIKSY